MFGSVFLITLLTAVIAFMLAVTLRRAADAAVVGYRAKIIVTGGVFLPRDKGARLAYKGVCCCLRQNYEKAVFFLEEALKHSYDPQNCVFCLDWMARCYDASGKPDRSLNCCVKAVEASPNSTSALFNLADRYFGRGQFEKARYYYNEVLKYEESNNYAAFMPGVLDMLGGNYEKAAEAFYPAASAENPFFAADAAVIAAISGDREKSLGFLELVKQSDYRETERLSGRIDCIERVRKMCADDS